MVRNRRLPGNPPCNRTSSQQQSNSDDPVAGRRGEWEVVTVTPHRLGTLGLRAMQVSGAVLLAALMTGCGGQSGHVITAPAQHAEPGLPPATAPGTSVTQDTTPAERPATTTAQNTGAQATPRTSTAQAQANRVERCHTSMLTGSLQPTEAGAGQRYAELVLRNSSNETCTLYGYGGLQLIDASGKPLPTTLERTPNLGPSLITLAPGATASKTLHWTAVPHEGEPADGPCQPTPARVEVIPPDETDPLSITWQGGPVCGFGSIDGSAYHQ
ncbi:lipoprotein [Saccharopolyspora subtropica]|uniref:Lipoprotein n=1 Tax=Saccharopolyspora thermophila TaxID=89367 RepID=A0A917N6G3_9PSEU|nr:lipoprotein [Saccharopolyspora subtropica]